MAGLVFSLTLLLVVGDGARLRISINGSSKLPTIFLKREEKEKCKKNVYF
jgi:hypothetical protein